PRRCQVCRRRCSWVHSWVWRLEGVRQDVPRRTGDSKRGACFAVPAYRLPIQSLLQGEKGLWIMAPEGHFTRGHTHRGTWLGLFREADDVACQRLMVVFSAQQAGGTVADHQRDVGVCGGEHGKTSDLRLKQHRRVPTFSVAVGGGPAGLDIGVRTEEV